MRGFLFNEFQKYLILSIVLIAAGLIIADRGVDGVFLKYVSSLVSNIFLTLGSALFIGAIFTYVIQTESFVEYMTLQLKRIVVSKEFVWKLSESEKKLLLESAIGPEGDLSKSYSEIPKYFQSCVDGIIKRFGESFRGQMNIMAVAKFDFAKKCVKIEWETYHAIYKTGGKFEPISYHLNCGDSGFEHVYVRIEAVGNKYKVFDKSSISEQCSTLSGMQTKVEINVPEEFVGHGELFVRRKFIEHGQDHWQFFMYKATKPCHRLMVSLRCENGIKIREYAVVGTNEDFIITGPDDDRNHIEFCYNDWLDAGYGVCAVLSLDHEMREALIKKDRDGCISSDVAANCANAGQSPNPGSESTFPTGGGFKNRGQS